MAGRSIFTGCALQAIDGKGRVALPATMRVNIERQGGASGLLLSIDSRRGCLRVADLGWTERLYERQMAEAAVARQAGREIDHEEIGSDTFGHYNPVPFDASGRFILPQYERKRGDLSDLAFFWGAGDTIEMWDPRVLIAHPTQNAEKKDRCAWEMEQRGVA